MRPLALLSLVAFCGLAPLTVACTSLHPPTFSGSSVPTEQTPTERYEAYRLTLDHAQTIDELLPLTSDAVRDEMAKRPAKFQKALLADLQQRKVAWLRVIDEQISGDTAVLRVEGAAVVDPSRGVSSLGTAKVILFREHGAWRIDEETWMLEGHDTTGITPRDWAAASTKKW
jgi:hypothetical protein